MNYGRAIRICRIARGLTQTELGKLTGVTNGCISLLETNQRNPSVKLLERIIQTVGLSAPLFVALAGRPTAPLTSLSSRTLASELWDLIIGEAPK